MTLATSGTISIGGTTANRSINLELGRSATATSSLGESALRALANDTSGAISMSTFRGKSAAINTQTVTVGYSAVQQYLNSGYGSFTTGLGTNVNRNVGSISDGTFNPKSNMYIRGLWYSTAGIGAVVFALRSLNTTVGNSGWTTMNVAGVNFTRSSATYTNSNDANVGQTQWRWETSSNPFGTTVGATKVVTFT
jgi:hypothetical protein